MSNWLADHTGIHLNLRPLAPIAGGIIGNMLLPGLGGAALGAGMGRFLDGKGNNEGWGQAAKAGAITGGATYAGGKALSALQGAFAPSSAAGANIGANAGTATTPGAYTAPSGGGITSEMMPHFTPPPMATPAQPGGWQDAFTGGLKQAGSFAHDNPMAVSMGLQGLGSIASSGAQNDLARAQAHRMETQGASDDYELERKKRQDAALEPIRQALAGQLSQFRANKYGIAANPWTTGG